MADAAKKIVAAIMEPGVLGDEKAAKERENLKKRIEFFKDEIAKRKKLSAETISEMQTAHMEFPRKKACLSERRTLQSCCMRTPGCPELGPVGNESAQRAACGGVRGATAIIHHGRSSSAQKTPP